MHGCRMVVNQCYWCQHQHQYRIKLALSLLLLMVIIPIMPVFSLLFFHSLIFICFL